MDRASGDSGRAVWLCCSLLAVRSWDVQAGGHAGSRRCGFFARLRPTCTVTGATTAQYSTVHAGGCHYSSAASTALANSRCILHAMAVHSAGAPPFSYKQQEFLASMMRMCVYPQGRRAAVVHCVFAWCRRRVRSRRPCRLAWISRPTRDKLPSLPTGHGLRLLLSSSSSGE